MNIKSIIKKIFLIIPVRNIILMESNPDYSDNAKIIFNKLVENKVNEKYKIIWFVKDSKKYKNIKIKNVKFISVYSKYNIIEKIKQIYYIFSAKVILDSNKYIPKVRKKQFRLHLCHGTPLKFVSDYCKEIGDIDYILEISEFFKTKNSELFMKKQEQFLDLGFPRNDELFFKDDIENFFPEYANKNVIVWLPTYRKHENHDEYKESMLKYGLPAINSAEDFEKIDKVLEKNKAVILIKLHPAQDKKVIESFKCNNIRIITDNELSEKGINLYQLLAITNAMITDYSSVYYDYLLTRKPIGLAITDIEEYIKNVGLAYDYYDTIKGEYIYNSEELCKFIENLSKGTDKSLDERLKCLKLYHTYCDDKSAERVYEFIKKYL